MCVLKGIFRPSPGLPPGGFTWGWLLKQAVEEARADYRRKAKIHRYTTDMEEIAAMARWRARRVSQ
jgi:hypothetical protein